MSKRVIVLSLMIFSLALYLNFFPLHIVVPLKKPFADFPYNWRGWEGKSYFFDAAILDKLRVKEYLLREYVKDGRRFTLYVGYYGMQKEGAQIHSPKHCLPGGGWLKLSETRRSLDIDGVGKVKFIQAVYKKGSDKKMFVYWYKMKDAYITNEYILKWYMIVNSFRYRRNDAAFVRFSTDITEDFAGPDVMMEAMKDFLPLLTNYLPE
jgi:EpsI family protein